MAKFTDYTQKTKPADADLLLIHDNAGAANKKTPFSGVWSWILDKLASAVISQLETTSKSIIPAINELNSKIVASNSENNFDIVYPIYTGLKVLVVFSTMGTTGINGYPPVMFILSTNYDVTKCSISYLLKPDNCTVKVRVSEGNAVLNVSYDSGNANYVKSLFIPIG